MYSYVVVSTNLEDLNIYDGPYAWDEFPTYDPPMGEGYAWMLLEDAYTAGYTFPPPPITPSDVIMGNLLAALTSNDTYLSLSAPTAEDDTVQLAALTRQLNGLIRLATNTLDDVSDT